MTKNDPLNTKASVENNSIPKKENCKKPISDMLICFYKNKYIKVSTILSIIGLAITGAYSLFTIVLDYADRESSTYKTLLKQSKKQNDVLNKKYTELSEDFTEIKKLDLLPILLNPVGGKKTTDRQVSFRWKYDVDLSFKNFILELRQIDRINKTVLTRRYDIPHPERKQMDFYFPDKVTGEFFWRIGTGEILATFKNTKNIDHSEKYNRDIAKSIELHAASIAGKENQNITPINTNTRLWSRYGNFKLYNSVLDKIISEKEITVGTTASFLSYYGTLQDDGLPNTYDMKFLTWAIKELEVLIKDKNISCLKNINYEEDAFSDISINRKIFSWKNLLNNVSNGQVDIAIANITKSKKREKEFQGLKFTKGYRNNHQKMIFFKKEGKYNDNLKSLNKLKKATKNAIIATQYKTINYQAAQFLSSEKSFEFKDVKNSYKSYIEVVNAIRHGEADFGIIDDVRLSSILYTDIGVVDFDFDNLLNDFYQSQINIENQNRKENSKTETQKNKNNEPENKPENKRTQTPVFQGEEYAIAVYTDGKPSCLLETLNKVISSPKGIKKRLELEGKH